MAISSPIGAAEMRDNRLNAHWFHLAEQLQNKSHFKRHPAQTAFDRKIAIARLPPVQHIRAAAVWSKLLTWEEAGETAIRNDCRRGYLVQAIG